jgi:hypothetical protein
VDRASDVIRVLGIVAFLLGVGFLFAPTDTAVQPLAVPEAAESWSPAPDALARADSLTEDIILHNLFSPSRTAPSRRYAASATSVNQDMGVSATNPDANIGSAAGGFRPELIGTAVSERPAETRALLRLLASDATPRLYAVGDRAGGYSVVSIDARAVVLAGPRGRVVLRLPEDEESDS